MGALRVAADPQRRDDGRQRRERLADRRFDAGADRPRRDGDAAQPRAGADAADGGSLPRLHEEGDGADEILEAIDVPLPTPALRFRTYKLSKRFDSDISAVCAAFAIELDGDRIRRCRVAFGGVAATPKRAPATEAALTGAPWNEATARTAMERARHGLRAAHRHAGERRLSPADRAESPVSVLSRDAAGRAAPGPRRQRLCASLSRDAEVPMNRQAEAFMARSQALPAAGVGHPHESAHLHVAGEATYVDDIPEIAGTLHAALGLSEKAHARIRSIDLAAVRATPGVVAVLTAADIPGPNDCGPIVHDDPILADGVVQYVGQPMFAVVAETNDIARRAARLAKVDYEVLPPVLTPQEAKRLQSYVLPPMHLVRGDPATAMAAAPRRMAGEFYVGGQEQFYLEGQISYAVPKEDGCIHLYCSTQHPTEMQHVVAHALELVANQVTVEMRRMGGGFGGKESQSALFACVAAVAAQRAAAAGEDPARPGRRLHVHREAALLPLRVRSRLRRRRRDPRGEGGDGGARRLLRGPLRSGVHARGVPLRQRVLSAGRRHPGARRQDQHAVEYRVSRLRRAAGRDRDRIHHRQHRARARARSARRPEGELLRHDRAQRHALRHDGRRQRDPRARRRARGVVRLPAAPQRDPGVQRVEPGAEERAWR